MAFPDKPGPGPLPHKHPPGRWQAAAGRPAVADSLLSYVESGASNIPGQMIMRQTMALASLERARTWQRGRDAAQAARFYYREFLRVYDLPPAVHRRYVEEAIAAVAGSRGR